MKKAGVILFIAGLILTRLAAYDLFGNKNLPIPLTVTIFISGFIIAFTGPAIFSFSYDYSRRKKIEKRSLIIACILIILGIIAQKLQWPAAKIIFTIGILILCFFYGTLSFKNKYEKWKKYARTKYDAFFLSLFDFLGIGSVLLGLLFRYQHWPLAELMTIIGFYSSNRNISLEPKI